MAEENVSLSARTVKRFQEEQVWHTGKFSVDSEGKVWRDGKRAENKTGEYLQVKVMVNGIRYYTCAHRLVWRALVGPIPTGMVVNHKNGQKSDNRPSNLELVTYSGNTKHAYQVGLMDEHGEDNPAAKLSDHEVAEIRVAYASGGFTQKQLADKYGVVHQQVSRIVRGHRRRKQSGPVITHDLRHASDRDQETGRFFREFPTPATARG